jgi:hypothetical protein
MTVPTIPDAIDYVLSWRAHVGCKSLQRLKKHLRIAL